jgi:hypothetical protein
MAGSTFAAYLNHDPPEERPPMPGRSPDELPDELRKEAERIVERRQGQRAVEHRAGANMICEDPDLQSFALRQILEDHPNLYSVADIARVMANGKPASSLTNDMLSAADELARAGLLRKIGGGDGDDFLLVPTIPSLHFNALLAYFT